MSNINCVTDKLYYNVTELQSLLFCYKNTKVTHSEEGERGKCLRWHIFEVNIYSCFISYVILLKVQKYYFIS